jgi:hypothetical protein
MPAPAPEPGPGEQPLRWTKHLKLANLAAIPAAMEEKLGPNGEALTLGRGEWKPEGTTDTVEVRTCTSYLKAIDGGYEAQDTFQATQESFFKARCTPLWFLRVSRPSRVSHVKDLRLDGPAPLSVLPGRINLLARYPEEEEEAAMAKGGTIASIFPKIKVKSKEATSVVFVDRDSQMEGTVDVVAWGDFDHDGIEDVLLFCTKHSLEGSYRSYGNLIVTRKAAGAPLVVVRELNI